MILIGVSPFIVWSFSVILIDLPGGNKTISFVLRLPRLQSRLKVGESRAKSFRDYCHRGAYQVAAKIWGDGVPSDEAVAIARKAFEAEAKTKGQGKGKHAVKGNKGKGKGGKNAKGKGHRGKS